MSIEIMFGLQSVRFCMFFYCNLIRSHLDKVEGFYPCGEMNKLPRRPGTKQELMYLIVELERVKLQLGC